MAKSLRRLDSIVQNRPVFIPVPKPINQMSTEERDNFVEEILKIIVEQYK